jgi:transposase
MHKITRVGVDLAKNTIQVHAVDAAGIKVTNKALKRDQFLSWCTQQLPPGCLIAIEGTSGAHYWGRQLRQLGFDARLIAAHLASPYRMAGKHGKNDANDAAAICEAAARPEMRFIPIKSTDQQAKLAIHSFRELLKKDRTAAINQIRATLTEFGIVIPKDPDSLRVQFHDLIEDGSNEMTGITRILLQETYFHWIAIEEKMAWCEQQIGIHIAQDEKAQKAKTVPGIGPITASATVATVVDFHQFKNGAQFGAWIGLTPKQFSTGGMPRLGPISKHGNAYLRSLLIQGAKSVVFSAHLRTDSLSKWVLQLKIRVGWQKAAVALANKNARILWAIMTKGIDYDPNYKSQKPGAQNLNSASAHA